MLILKPYSTTEECGPLNGEFEPRSGIILVPVDSDPDSPDVAMRPMFSVICYLNEGEFTGKANDLMIANVTHQLEKLLKS